MLQRRELLLLLFMIYVCHRLIAGRVVARQGVIKMPASKRSLDMRMTAETASALARRDVNGWYVWYGHQLHVFIQAQTPSVIGS